jgi:hypothetical protein
MGNALVHRRVVLSDDQGTRNSGSLFDELSFCPKQMTQSVETWRQPQ